MATAGSGDVLAGMVAALIGQGMDAVQACILGVYLHGMAGDYASTFGIHPIVASDITQAIPQAIGDLFIARE